MSAAMIRGGRGFGRGLLLTTTILTWSQTAWAQSSPSPYTSAVRYDANGRATGTIAPDPDGAGPLQHAATRTTYDPAGRPIKVETGELWAWQSEAVAPANWPNFTVLSRVDTTFDPMERKLTERTRGADGVAVSLVQYSYDGLGRLRCTAQRMNPALYDSLPASACTLGAEGGFGPDRIARNSYDAAGQLLTVEKAVGTSIAKVEARYTYTPNGKRASLTDARGYTAGMYYDGHDRLVGWALPSGTPGAPSSTDYESYAYDANGNRTSMRKRDGWVLEFRYDALNRLTTKIVPERVGLSPTHTRDVYYGYDLRGLQTYARFDGPGGEGITNGWDGFGRQTSSVLQMDGQYRSLNFGYDANGNRNHMTYPNGASYITYAYDGLNRQVAMYENGSSQLTNAWYNARGTPSAFSRRAGDHTIEDYDAVGRLSSYTHNFVAGTGNVNTTLSYTPASQIERRARSNSLYDWSGHRNDTRAYTANHLNQYTGVGPNPYTYDANGNLTSDALTSYQYDVENRLVSVGGQNTAQLRYDPLGRLHETIAGNGAVTRFLYDNEELVVEYGGAGDVLRQYVHGSGTDDPLIWYEGSSFGTAAARYLYGDHQGSVIAVSGSNGAKYAINTYDEYGVPGSANQGRFQYTGQAWLPEVGLYHYKARVYSPTLGRFLQTDPIGYDDQINLYAYVANDPVNGSDFSGMAQDDKEFKIPQLVGQVKVTYNDSGITVKVDNPVYSAEATASTSGVSLTASSGNIEGQARADANGVSAAGRAGEASASASASQDGVAGSARAGNVSVRANADRNGASVTGRAGDRTTQLQARTIQPEKVPAEFRGREGVERARTGTPAPRTFGQKVMEGLRAAVSLFNPWKDR